MLALSGVVLFAILDYSGFFLREIHCAIPAVIYENEEAVSETTITVDGSLQFLGRKSFQGQFCIEGVEVTGQEHVTANITWDHGYQQITYYYSPGLSQVDTPIQLHLYISLDFQHFALSLEDGPIIATNPILAKLQAIEGCRYALSYDSEHYPYFSYYETP